MPIQKNENSEWLINIDGKVKEPFRCKTCDDDYYAVYKDFKDTCFVCAIKSEINERRN